MNYLLYWLSQEVIIIPSGNTLYPFDDSSFDTENKDMKFTPNIRKYTFTTYLNGSWCDPDTGDTGIPCTKSMAQLQITGIEFCLAKLQKSTKTTEHNFLFTNTFRFPYKFYTAKRTTTGAEEISFENREKRQANESHREQERAKERIWGERNGNTKKRNQQQPHLKKCRCGEHLKRAKMTVRLANLGGSRQMSFL